MSELLTKERTVVIPGEAIAQGMDFIPGYGTYRMNDTVRAARLGLLSNEGKVLKIIPLSGVYLPKKNDVVIGKITDISLMGWRMNITGPYSSMMNVKDASFDFIEKGADLTRYFDIGDYVVAKVTNVTTQYLVDVAAKGPGLKRLKGGQVVEVNTHKVPRIIGKKGSMVSMIKQATGCQVNVGQNGRIWVEGEPAKEIIAIETIKKIENESHTRGLTETIKQFLETKTGVKVDSNKPQGDNNQQGEKHDPEKQQS